MLRTPKMYTVMSCYTFNIYKKNGQCRCLTTTTPKNEEIWNVHGKRCLIRPNCWKQSSISLFPPRSSEKDKSDKSERVSYISPMRMVQRVKEEREELTKDLERSD